MVQRHATAGMTIIQFKLSYFYFDGGLYPNERNNN